MQPLALRSRNDRIAQGPRRAEAVDPSLEEGIFLTHIFIGGGLLLRHHRIGPQGIGEQVEAASQKGRRYDQHDNGSDSNNPFHDFPVLCIQNSRRSKNPAPTAVLVFTCRVKDQFLPSLVRICASMSSVMRERSHSGFQPHSSRAQVSSSELGQLSAISRFTGSMS